MNLKEFERKIITKSSRYDPGSTESHFLEALFVVVKKNYKMFNLMHHHVGGLRSSDSLLCQSDGKPKFPKKEVIDKLVKKKDLFENRLINILISLKPAYQYLEQLVAALDSIDGNLKIDQQQFIEMNSEAVIVKRVYRHFDRVFKSFAMKDYRKHVREIRRIIVIDSEEADGIKMATERLNKELAELDKIYPTINEAFTLSLDIDFNALQKATKRFSELVKKALGSKKVSSIEDTMRALKYEEAKLNGKIAEEEAAVMRTQMASSVDRAMMSLKAQEARLLSDSSSPSRPSSFGSSEKEEMLEEKREEKKSKKFIGSKLLKRLIK